MSPNDLYSLLRAKPFAPFRVVTSDGITYEVRHPEMVMVTIPSLIIGYPHETVPDVVGRYDIVSMRHVVRLEPQPRPQPAPKPEDHGQ